MRRPAKPEELRRVVARATAALVIPLLACACSAVRHGYTAADFAGRTLVVATPEGAERLQLEVDYDQAVSDVVKLHGRPDQLHVADRDHLYLFYPDRDLVCVIERDLLPPGRVVTNSPIPGHFFRLLPAADVRRIQARRAARASTRPVARRSPRGAAPPAAVSPHASALSMSEFDLDLMVERLRRPLSAADAGVSDWRVATLSNGTRARVARSGATEYRIQPNAVLAATPIRPRARSAPADATLVTLRVNRAVFGTRAQSVSQSVAPLVARVAGDPSGRTRSVKRLAGRTVSVTRDTRRGLLLYAVHAD